MEDLIKALSAHAAATQGLADEVRALTQQTQALILALAEQELDEASSPAYHYLDGTPR